MEKSEKYRQYIDALTGVGTRVKEIVLERAAHDDGISLWELVELVRYAEGA